MQTKSEESLLNVLSRELECSIKEDSQVEERVKVRLMGEYSKQRDGAHVSDLVLCMRQSLFRKLRPVPPTVKQIGYFLDGARRHEALQSLYGEGVVEKKGEFEGVSFSIDIHDGFPIEFKTTRAKNAISEHWVRQLVYYMLATGSRTGILQVQRIMPSKGSNESLFPAYLVQLDEEQFQYWQSDFVQRRDLFFNAALLKEPSLVPAYRGEGDWLCRERPYRKECDEIEDGNKGREG
jgi:hypothetical protein